jgi:hypothetical protein
VTIFSAIKFIKTSKFDPARKGEAVRRSNSLNIVRKLSKNEKSKNFEIYLDLFFYQREKKVKDLTKVYKVVCKDIFSQYLLRDAILLKIVPNFLTELAGKIINGPAILVSVTRCTATTQLGYTVAQLRGGVAMFPVVSCVYFLKSCDCTGE